MVSKLSGMSGGSNYSNSNGNGNGNGKSKKQKQEEEYDKSRQHYDYVQTYSDSTVLAEAVIVGGKPFFAISHFDSTDITLEKEIQLDDEKKTILKPPEKVSYINKPYTFESEAHFSFCVNLAAREDLDSLNKMVKEIWKKYIDADDEHISICAADTVFTYFQDIIGMTHYLFFVGDNDSGKSNNLVVIHMLAYRNLMSLGISVANIYQFLGSRVEGAGTICEDEANQIDEDKDKMEVAKSGYTKGYPVVKTTITPFGRYQSRFNTFCFKAYSAEKSPDSGKGRGLVQRLVKLRCTAGNPQYDILEVLNPAGDETFQKLFD
jgi:hypothetical protein